MQFISLQNLAAQAREAARRFPLVLLSAVTAATAGFVLVDLNDNKAAIRVLLVALLGLPLFTAVVTTGERANWTGARRAIAQAGVALLLVALWLALGPWTDTMRFTRFAHLAVLAHLAVAVLPFVGTRLDRAFWQFNRLIFIRYLLGGLFAAVLFGGLAIALAAINQLFGVKIEGEWYARLWIVMALVFHPWFFLGGVPRDVHALDTRDDYPAGLKVFAQFILIPVVTVYMLILTAYLVRVVVTRTWPSGWIGYLVSSVAAAGTLALLLVHPARERADSRWVDVYGRWFYVALLPSIGMLLMATWLRIDQYGITEKRYFLAILALWLAGIAVYYGITGSRNIRVIPTTLGVLAVVTFLGPWSAYDVSLDSQRGRLRDMLVRNGILVDSRLARAPREVSFEQRREMSDLVRYLVDMHGPRALAPLSDTLRRVAENPPLRRADPSSPDNAAARAVMDALGIAYVSRWDVRGNERMTRFSAAAPGAVPLEGYDWVTRASLVSPIAIAFGSDTLTFTPDSQPARVIVSRGGQRLLDLPTWQLLGQARERERTDTLSRAGPPSAQRAPAPASPIQPSGPAPLVLDAEGNGLRLRLIVSNLSGTGDSTRARLTNVDATVLVRFVRP